MKKVDIIKMGVFGISLFCVFVFFFSLTKPLNVSANEIDNHTEGPIIGVMVSNQFFNGMKPEWESKIYREKFTEVFGWGILGAVSKFWNILPKNSTEFVWRGVDIMCEWYENNGPNVGFYHNLVWDRWKKGIPRWPQWYQDLGQIQRRQAIENYVRGVVKHFKGRIPVYVAVNHALRHGSDDNFMGTGWGRVKAITEILTWAHEEDPSAIMIINEGGDSDPRGGIMTNLNETRRYVELINNLLDMGAPLGGVGSMCHFGQGSAMLPSDEVLKSSLDLLNSTGLPIFVTEFDVSYDYRNVNINPDESFKDYDTWWDYQAYAYKHAIELFSSYPAVKAIFLWGFYDGQTWREGAGLFRDQTFEPKPVYYALEPIFKEAKTRKLFNKTPL